MEPHKERRLLLLTPPMTQLNSPYPATCFLKAGVGLKNWHIEQVDFSLEFALKLFEPESLTQVFKISKTKKLSKRVQYLQKKHKLFISSMPQMLQVLQKRTPPNKLSKSLETLIWASPLRNKETQIGKRFFKDFRHNFQDLEEGDGHRHLISLLIGDFVCLIQESIDPHFGLTRWGEAICSNQPSFEALETLLKQENSFLDQLLEELVREKILKNKFHAVAFSTPFPGNVWAAFKMARILKRENTKLPTIWGGGYVNTELRELKSSQVFSYFDFVCLDDGAMPLQLVLESLEKPTQAKKLKRTFVLESGKVQLIDNAHDFHDKPFSTLPAPDYSGLDFSRYLCFLEVPNPMYRLWSDEKWNKLIVAHGCYWKKCTFCDLSLDYIKRYETSPAARFVDHMENLIEQNGNRNFHLVDEAAPPASLRAIAEEILKRKLDVQWWGNIRFEKSFDIETCELMSAAGCIAVTGGLEVASNRLLKLINKGVSLEQVARVTKNFSDAGILVHAYLMYGFPTQTVPELVDSLEYVRQLFVNNCIHSAFWHRFAATAHSPVGQSPQRFRIKLEKSLSSDFSRNEVFYKELKGNIKWEAFDPALSKATYNFMLGVGWNKDVRSWFDRRLPRSSVAENFISEALTQG